MWPETSTRKLSCPAVIVLEQAADPRLAADRRGASLRRIDWHRAATSLWDGQIIVDSLMRPILVSRATREDRYRVGGVPGLQQF